MMMMDDGDEIIHLISVLWMDMKEMMMIAMHTQMLRNSDVVVFTTIITIVQNRDLFNEMEFFLYINSILAVIYLTKLQNLINRPVMNCSMSIFPYFYFSNYILFDFPSSGLIFL